tara:strand:- start:531 stop:740 length:210 start_codon:yes stop_codon:yes gene_type:complete
MNEDFKDFNALVKHYGIDYVRKQTKLSKHVISDLRNDKNLEAKRLSTFKKIQQGFPDVDILELFPVLKF